jgi:hypothetical protein
MATMSGRPSSHLSFRWPYQAIVMNTFEPMRRRMTLAWGSLGAPEAARSQAADPVRPGENRSQKPKDDA